VILLDTDHINALQYEGTRAEALLSSVRRSSDQDFATTIITVEEQMRGWLALIHQSSVAHSQIPAYERLLAMIAFFSRWKILQFDDRATDQFERLRKTKIRLGTMDLKIASIALANNALLLSGNRRDFQRVAELRVENWLV
jgi:tRNA(fMet)-specific endonuclease VapC